MVPLTFSPLSLPASLSSSPCVLLYASANINRRIPPGASHLLPTVVSGAASNIPMYSRTHPLIVPLKSIIDSAYDFHPMVHGEPEYELRPTTLSSTPCV